MSKILFAVFPALTASRAFWLSVVTLALPVALQMLLQSLLGMADVLMVGQLGSSAIAAVGLAAKLHFLLLVLMAGFGAGCSVLVAQYSGAKDHAACQRVVALGLIVGVAVMIPFVVLFALLSPYWVPLINPDPEVSAMAASYLQITALVLLFTQCVVIFESGLRSIGNTAVPLLMGGLAVAINVLLNYLLIFGHWGFPALGIEGAAWATLISRFLQLLGFIVWLYAKRHPFALGRKAFALALNKKEFRRFVSFSSPVVMNHVVWGVGNAAYHVLTGYAGTEALAVMGVIVPIEGLFFSLFVGLSNASTIMVGRSLGASEQDRAWFIYKFFDQLTLAMALGFSLALFLSRSWVVGIFGELDEQTVLLLNDTLALFCLLIWVKVLNMVRILGVLRAGGDNKFCLAMDSIVMWLIGIPIFSAAVFWGGVPFLFIYFATFIEDITKFTPVRLRIGKRIWMKNLTVY
ncbi:putative efflux protein, MATE family [Alteromonadaceae bacterium Bs31]|nr:putative efflux protein, MATE family [Alteromonadaceae bacterium Bs31]